MINLEQIYKEVLANRDKLNSCDKHQFDTPTEEGKVVGVHWICSNCGGEVDGSAKLWYEKGREHGKS